GSLAAGIVRAGSGRLSLYNSVVAGNRIGETPADIGGEVYNSFIQSSLIADPASSGGIVHGEQGNGVGLDGLELIPYSDLLGAPSYSYGGSTLAAAPVPGSPLLGAGNPDLLPPDNLDFDSDSDTNEGIPSDQRGAEYPRLSPEETVSIGAVEGNLWSGRAPSTVYVAEEDDFLIEIDPDGDGLSIGDRVTWLSVNQGTVSGLVYGVDALASLKEAVEEAVATAGTVRIAAGTYTSDQYIMIQRDLTLIGDGAQHTILDQKRKNNALWVRSSAVATIRHLTITNADHPFEHI